MGFANELFDRNEGSSFIGC